MVAQAPRKNTAKRTQRPSGRKTKLSDSLKETVKTEVTEEKKATLLGEEKKPTIEIAAIRRDVGLQPRLKISEETIEDYKEKLQSGIKFPPVTIFYDGTNYYLADGYHRTRAHEELGDKEIEIDIKQGSLEEAKWFSYAVNANHGLPRSTDDKARAIRSALSHPNATKMNDSELGRYLNVAPKTIKNHRIQLGVEKPEKRTVTRNGTSYEQKVKNSAGSSTQSKSQNTQSQNKYEFWEQNGEWEIPIPGDLLSSKIVVTFTVRANSSENEKYEFSFRDKQKALLSDNRVVTVTADEEKEAATPYLYAQGLIKEWVENEEEMKKRLFQTKDGGFLPGVRVDLAGKKGNISLVQSDGNLCIRFDDGEIIKNEDPKNLEIIPVKVWSVGDIVKISPNYKRTNWEFWCRQEKVQVTQKHENNLYEIKDFNRAEGKRKSLIFHWWEIEGIQEPATEIENQPDITTEVSKVVETIDYYLRAIGCLPELSDQDLLQLKAALEREIKLRNLEVVDDLQKFQTELVKYAASQGKSSPEGWAHTVIKNHKNGEISPLWEDFVQGRPLGSGSAIKRDWEIESGVPYPAFKEERVQYYVAKGEPLESAIAKAGNELRNPELAKDLWEGFLRKSDRIADDALKAKSLGATPYLPPAFSQGETITKESVMAKLEAVAEQHSLPESKPETQPEQSEIKSDEPAAKPTIEQLQKCLDFPATKGIAMLRIKENPQWGYLLVDGKITTVNDEIVKTAKYQIPELIIVIKEVEEWSGKPHFLAINNNLCKYQRFNPSDDQEKWVLTDRKFQSISEVQVYYEDILSNPEIIFKQEGIDLNIKAGGNP